MKIKDILEKSNQPIKNDECVVCEYYNIADIFFNSQDSGSTTECPSCHTLLNKEYNEIYDEQVIGADNTRDEEQEFYYSSIHKCPECKDYFSMLPVPIHWNANHDIYYTGGNKYIINDPDFDKLKSDFQEELEKYIDNFLTRRENGENLKSWNLAYWLAGSFEHTVSKFLYEKGLKK